MKDAFELKIGENTLDLKLIETLHIIKLTPNDLNIICQQLQINGFEGVVVYNNSIKVKLSHDNIYTLKGVLEDIIEGIIHGEYNAV